MNTLLFFILLPLTVFVGRPSDPAPGPWQSKEEARNLECTRITQAKAHELRPDAVSEPFARGEFGVTDALACRRRFLPLGERPARDELILSSLSQTVGEITGQAAGAAPRGVTFHVDAFYPDPAVASKISVAARTGLAEQGYKVSDRVPLLAAGDLSVLGKMSPREAYPLACARYFAEKSLTEGQALLGLMIVDSREAQLHAGLCVNGGWTWLR